jgi:hypothetical protein
MGSIPVAVTEGQAFAWPFLFVFMLKLQKTKVFEQIEQELSSAPRPKLQIWTAGRFRSISVANAPSHFHRQFSA